MMDVQQVQALEARYVRLRAFVTSVASHDYMHLTRDEAGAVWAEKFLNGLITNARKVMKEDENETKAE